MTKLTKQKQINQLIDNEAIADIFVVKIKKGVTSYKKGYCITLILSDSSGASIEYKYWGNQDENKVNNLYSTIKTDDIILVTGRITSYENKLQITANDSNQLRVLNEDEYDANFINAPKKDLNEMWAILITKINTMGDTNLKQFLLDIFEGPLQEKIKKHPGAIEIHHNWIGGLIQHTLEVIEYCEVSIKQNPELNSDLLLAGAILHDIGKLDELEVTSRIKSSRQGQLIGHLTLGLIFVVDKLKEYNIDDILREKLLHLLVSHHGKFEYGSPKEPMIPEAIALYYADELSSKLSAMIELIKNSNTEDDFMYDRRNAKNVFLR